MLVKISCKKVAKKFGGGWIKALSLHPLSEGKTLWKLEFFANTGRKIKVRRACAAARGAYVPAGAGADHAGPDRRKRKN